MNLNADKKTTLTATITPAGALINGILSWTFDTPGIVQLFPSADGTQCDALWAGPGDVVITATGNAELDSTKPVKLIHGTYTITALVRPTLATGITITASPEVDSAA